VQSSRLQQLVLLVDDASSAWGRRQQKIVVRRPISFVPPGLHSSFFAAAIDRWNQNGQHRPQSYNILGCLCFGRGVARSRLFFLSGARALFVKAKNGG
jgi:hypothetical protein